MPSADKEKARVVGLEPVVSLGSPGLHPYIHILNQHYRSFCAFQYRAMVMEQLLRQRNSGSRHIKLRTPRTTITSLEAQRSLPSSSQELQSDQGYSSSMTSDTRSSRLSTDSYTSSTDTIRSTSATPDSSGSRPSLHDVRSLCLDDVDNTLQGNEVSSTVSHPRFGDVPVFEDNIRASSKLPPLFCEENSCQGVVDIPMDSELEERSLSMMPATSDYRSQSQSSRTVNGDPVCEIDYVVNVKGEIDSSVKFMNSDVDVMWAVKPELPSERKSTLVPSPDKWSNDDPSDSSQIYISSSSAYSQNQCLYPLQGMAPVVRSLQQTKAKQKSRKQLLTVNDDWHIASESMQMEAMDLSLPRKRKTPAPITEIKRKPTVQQSEHKRSLVSPRREKKKKHQRKPKTVVGENHLSVLPISEKSIVNVNLPSGMKRVLQVSSDQNQIHTAPKNASNGVQRKSSCGSANSIGHVSSKPEKKFACDVCDKRYSQRSSLHTHTRIHTGVRPYTCKDCGRSFTDCSTYIKHCRLHTGEKPYACAVCARRFTQSGNMMRHQQKCKGRT